MHHQFTNALIRITSIHIRKTDQRNERKKAENEEIRDP